MSSGQTAQCLAAVSVNLFTSFNLRALMIFYLRFISFIRERLTLCFQSYTIGQRTLHHRSDALETVVLVNPSQDTVVSEVMTTYSEA